MIANQYLAIYVRRRLRVTFFHHWNRSKSIDINIGNTENAFIEDVEQRNMTCDMKISIIKTGCGGKERKGTPVLRLMRQS